MSNGMDVINIPTMISMIRQIGIGLREPLMFWGQPGCGKSEGVAQATAQAGGTLVDIRLSQYDSVDLRGIPVPSDNLTVWHAPSTLPFKGNSRFVEDDKPIVLFLDEINAAAPATSAVAYQLINEFRVGEHVLMDNVVPIAAGNRDGDRGITNRMPTPLANRFTHAEIGVDVEAWCEWAQSAGLPAIGVAFMQFRKELLSTFDPASPAKAFATPRTWAKALKYYAAGLPRHVLNPAIAGAVGEGPAAEFHGFCDIWQKMVPIADIIANPTGVALPDEPGMRYAVTVAVSGAMNQETVGPLNQFLERLDPEFNVLAWHLAVRRDESIMATREFVQDFSRKFHHLWTS